MRATLMLATILGLGAPTAFAAPSAAPITAAAAQVGIAAWRVGAWHFEGRIAGMPPGRTILMALTPTPDGLDGETLELGPGRIIRAAAPVRGTFSDGQCHLQLEIAGAALRLDGLCTPTLVAGQTTRPQAMPGTLARLLLPVGLFGNQGDATGEGLAGEAWLAPSPAADGLQ